MAKSNKKRNKITVKRPIASSDVIGKKKPVAASAPKEKKPEVPLPENKDNPEPPAPPVVDPPVTDEPPVTPPITTDPEQTDPDPGYLPPAANNGDENIEKTHAPKRMVIPTKPFDPFDMPVIEKEYTRGLVNEKELEGINDVIPEAAYNPVPDTDDIPEAGAAPNADSANPNQEQKPEGKDLSPSQKRQAAEATANLIMNAYCSYVPAIFVKMASIPEDKIRKLSLEDKIDPFQKIDIGPDKTTTIFGFIIDHNESVKKAFQIKEETRAAILEALIDVLLEQELVLTPTQRLLIAVGMNIGAMALECYGISRQNGDLLKSFQQFHEDNKKILAIKLAEDKARQSHPPQAA